MATYSDVMRWVAELDNTGVLKGFDEIRNEGTSALEDVGDAGEQTSGRFSGIGGKMGKAMVAGFAAVGVGALLLKGIEDAFNRQDALKVVTARFDLTAQEAQKYGKIAGDLYADGWGDGFEQVQSTAALVGERLKISNEEVISALTTQALTIEKVWGEDVDAVLRSTSQLLENDLVDSAQEGMDLIVAAFQNGGNEAGDLLDTIDEYSQHFETMGLSGEEAMNLLISGIQNGQRDTDKLADAVKELRIRAVEDTDAISDAYHDLGLNADDTRRAFLAGGEEAREAYLKVIGALNDVEDPIEQNRLAVELIGTQFEDLGPKALDALDDIEGKLGDVEGAANDAAAAVEANEWERFKRRGENALSIVGEAFAGGVNAVMDYNNAVIDAGMGFLGFGKEAEKSSKIVDQWAQDAVDAALEVKRVTEEGNVVTADATAEQEAHADALGTTAWELEQLHGQVVESNEVTHDFVAAQEEANEELERAREVLRRHREAQQEFADRVSGAMSGATDAVFDFTEETLSDVDAWQQEMLDRAAALEGWQDNIATIAAATSVDFALYLAEMGEAGAGLVQELANNEGELEESFAAYNTLAEAAGTDMVETMRAAGADVAAGLAAGIEANAYLAAVAATDMAQRVIDETKGKFEIRSPSELFAREVGKPIVEGIEEGIQRDGGRVADALVDQIEQAGEAAVDEAEDVVDRLEDALSGTLSGIKRQRRIGDIKESIFDAKRDLNNAAAAGDFDAEERARETIEDLSFRLFEELLKSGASRDRLKQVGLDAGLSSSEITTILGQSSALRTAQDSVLTAEQSSAVSTGTLLAKVDELIGVIGGGGGLALSGGYTINLNGFANEQSIQMLIDAINEVRRREAGAA